MALVRSRSVLLLCFIYIYCCKSQNDVVVLSPESFVASEGSERVNYTCSTAKSDRSSSTIVILVNGLQPTDEVKRMRGIETLGINSTTRRLSIETLAINNDTELLCQAVFGDSIVRTEVLYFRVQGVLSPPTEFEISSDSSDSFQRLSWTPPFTLDITGVAPDITGYRVCFYFSQPPICSTREEPYFDFLNINLPLTFVVSAINVVGESNSTDFSRPACGQNHPAGMVFTGVNYCQLNSFSQD